MSFDNASQEVIFKETINKIAAERAFASAGSDEGLVPLYALLNELKEDFPCEEKILSKVEPCIIQLSDLLEEAKPLDESSLDTLDDFLSWAQEDIKTEESPNTVHLNLEEDKSILEEFQTEAFEHLEESEEALLFLENNPQDKSSLIRIFRAFHTIKGVSGFLNLHPIQALTHEAETLLSLAQDNKIKITNEIITLILQSKDATKHLILEISGALKNNKQPENLTDVSDLKRKIHHVISQKQEADEKTENDTFTAKKTSISSTQNSTTRVNTTKLDQLINSVGELVIAESHLEENFSKTQNETLQKNISHIKRVTKELQSIAMSLRMVPIKPTFQKVNRLVRDLEKKNKEISKLPYRGREHRA